MPRGSHFPSEDDWERDQPLLAEDLAPIAIDSGVDVFSNRGGCASCLSLAATPSSTAVERVRSRVRANSNGYGSNPNVPAEPTPRPGAPCLLYLPGSTEKVCQLTGDFDAERGRPTASMSASLANVRGTDLGNSFSMGQQIYFLFGDTTRCRGDIYAQGDDCIAVAASTADPSTPGGPTLQWITEAEEAGESFVPTRIRPYDSGGGPGDADADLAFGNFSVPTGGFARDTATAYMFYTQWPGTHATGQDDGAPHGTVLAKSRDGCRSWENQYWVSFNLFYHVFPIVAATRDLPGLPSWGREVTQVVLMWGTSINYRQSDVYLACCPLDAIDNYSVVPNKRLHGPEWRYFSGTPDTPAWSEAEWAAQPLFTDERDRSGNPCIGEFSVAYEPSTDLWLMLYTRPAPVRGVICRHSRNPWGPWVPVGQDVHAPGGEIVLASEADVSGRIWMPDMGYGKYIHIAGAADGLLAWGDACSGNSLLPDQFGGEYSPGLVSSWPTRSRDSLYLYYTLSTSTPYQTILMRTAMRIACA